MDGHNTHFVGHHVSIFLFKKKDDSRGKKEEKLGERRVEKNAQTSVSELYSHGERIIMSHNIKKGVNEISELWLESFEEFEEYE